MGKTLKFPEIRIFLLAFFFFLFFSISGGISIFVQAICTFFELCVCMLL